MRHAFEERLTEIPRFTLNEEGELKVPMQTLAPNHEALGWILNSFKEAFADRKMLVATLYDRGAQIIFAPGHAPTCEEVEAVLKQ